MFHLLLSWGCVLLVVLCLLSPWASSPGCPPALVQVLRLHNIYGVLLIILPIVHGLVAGRAAAMGSGKILWIFLVLMGLCELFRGKLPPKVSRRIHRSFALLVLFFTIAHVGQALLF